MTIIFTNHAAKRILERKLDPVEVIRIAEAALKKAPNNLSIVKAFHGEAKLVIDPKNRTLITVINRKRAGARRNKRKRKSRLAAKIARKATKSKLLKMKREQP